MIIPPYLKVGDTIGITCPAGAVNLTDMEAMFNQLEVWGYRLKIGATLGSSYYKFAATDQARVADLQQMLDDEEIKAILFGRGGYGVVRIIDQLNFENFLQYPKWLVGYSDITCLHSHIHTQYNMASIHGHMGAAYRLENQDLFSTMQINQLLTGNTCTYNISTHESNRVGQAKGQLIGGNLALLSDLIGTKSDIDTTGKILVIEDIGEYKYNIDRMMWQLLRANKLNKLAGLIVGSFTDTLDNEVPFGMSEHEIVWEKVKDFNYPVCFNFPVGHQALNYPLKFGAVHTLTVEETSVILQENVVAQ